jgi:VIT1/CCC1 family predicted Fe2+/Mn2+ transporter
MRAVHRHTERHRVSRIGWLRAAVLGANDGLVSTASLIVGVASAAKSPGEVVVAGVAAVVAGAMSMAAGEYVSVSSQADTEKAELAREVAELRDLPEAEHEELAQIYIGRGVEPDTARLVATQLMAKDALSAHARDELGLSDLTGARPIQAALSSAGSFAAGAVLPLVIAVSAPRATLGVAVTVASLCGLAVLGYVGARAGDAPPWRGVVRVTLWGAVAMAVTALIGRLVGAAI